MPVQSYQKDALPPPSREQGGGSHEPEPASAYEQKLRQVWADVRQGAEHFHQRSVPLPVNRLGQFIHGLCLPFHLARVLLADRETRWRYLKVTFVQVAVVVALGVVFTRPSEEVVESVGLEEWSEEVEEAQGQAEAVRVEVEQVDQDEELAQVAQGVATLAAKAGADQETVRVAVQNALDEAKKAEEERRAAQELERPRKRTVHRFVYWAALLSSLHLAQWIVIALSRDYHTALSREVSLRTGLAPEDEPLTPRVRLNLPWMRNKLKRRWRAFVVFAAGVPLLWFISKFLPFGKEFLTVMLSVWGAWWFVVFSAGKSALAWNESEPREPWFLRGWKRLTTSRTVSSVAPLRGVMGAYDSKWTSLTRPVFSPVASVERQPWSLGGLAVARALATLPVVKCFLRPFIPVAAGHLLVAGGAGQGAGTASPRPSAPEAEAAPPPAASSGDVPSPAAPRPAASPKPG
ncbi:hypothetical protein F0U61_30805 [Archangium violaceum]|uniref:hypothetical protein n=1 Tax=Archangium violaceum TaxID=83451 RepID=UPI002B315A3B|nr:hypothetical protein F0U61_30805 [Archangium violaceum]